MYIYNIASSPDPFSKFQCKKNLLACSIEKSWEWIRGDLEPEYLEELLWSYYIIILVQYHAWI